MQLQKFITELKRRNVFKVATAYAIAGWLIIQVISTISPQLGFPEWVPAFIIVFVLIGLPLALIFAWAYELTPEGIKKSEEVVREDSVTQVTGKKINIIIITALSLAVVFLLTERIFFAESTLIERENLEAETAPSIAVLPFTNMSSDIENEYFSDGLSEELLNGLANLDGIQVAGRTSSFQFKGTNPDLRQVGTALGVEHILEGSVRKSGDNIRVTAQLIRADNGFHLWSETFDRRMSVEDVFNIQEEITRRVVEELKIRLLPNDEMELDALPTTDVEAYNAYLRATQLDATRITENLQQAIVLYERAIRIDPNFAKAYARLAIAQEIIADYTSVSPEDRRRMVRENIDKALLIDNNLPEAYAALGLFYTSDGLAVEAVQALERALDLNPNYALAYTWLGNAYSLYDTPAAAKAFRRAYQLDPLNLVNESNYGRALMFENKTDEAIAYYEDQLANNPKTSLFSYHRLVELYVLEKNNYPRAFEMIYKVRQLDADSPPAFAYSIIFSSLFNLTEYANYIQDLFESALPDYSLTNNSRLWLDYSEQNYSGVLGYIEFDYMKNTGFGSFEDTYIQITYQSALEENRLDFFEYVALYYHPEFTEQEVVLNINSERMAYYYVKMLKEEERLEEIPKFVNAFCALAKETAELARQNLDKESQYFSNLACAQLNNDFESFKAWYLLVPEEFSYAITYWDFYLKSSPWEFLKNTTDSELLTLRDTATASVVQQLSETIEVIRKYGEWDEAWESDVETILARFNEK